MLFVLLEESEGSLQQALELAVLGRGDQRLFEGTNDGLMVGYLVLGVILVEGCSAQRRPLYPLYGRRIGQGFAASYPLAIPSVY